MNEHLPVGGLPRDPEPSPPGAAPESSNDEPPADLTAAGELIAEVFPHLDPELVARVLALRVRPHHPQQSRPERTQQP